MSNVWDLYTLDDIEEDKITVERYLIDYEVEDDDWPEYDIPADDLVLNKDALLAIKLAQPLINKDDVSTNSIQQQEQQLQQQEEEEGEDDALVLKEAQSDVVDNQEAINNLINNNIIDEKSSSNGRNSNNAVGRNQDKEKEKEMIDAMQQKDKGSILNLKHVTIATTADEEGELLLSVPKLILSQQAKATPQQNEERIISADDTMMILLLSCIIIWLLFQTKKWWKKYGAKNSISYHSTEKKNVLPFYHDKKATNSTE